MTRSMLSQASELADLEDEANMPLEQLLARYGYVNNPQAAGPSHTSTTSDSTKAPPPTAPDPSPPQNCDHTSSRHEPSQKAGMTRPPQDTVAGLNPVVADVNPVVADVKPEVQAEQAAAAGMDAFEHSQALAERRASGSQAGPSAAIAPSPGTFTHQALPPMCCMPPKKILHLDAKTCVKPSPFSYFCPADGPKLCIWMQESASSLGVSVAYMLHMSLSPAGRLKRSCQASSVRVTAALPCI